MDPPVDPLNTDDPLGAVEVPPKTEELGLLEVPPKTEPLGAVEVPPKTEPLGAVEVPPKTDPLGVVVPPKTELLGATGAPPKTEALGVDAVPPKTDALLVVVAPPNTGVLDAAGVVPPNTEGAATVEVSALAAPKIDPELGVEDEPPKILAEVVAAAVSFPNSGEGLVVSAPLEVEAGTTAPNALALDPPKTLLEPAEEPPNSEPSDPPAPPNIDLGFSLFPSWAPLNAGEALEPPNIDDPVSEPPEEKIEPVDVGGAAVVLAEDVCFPNIDKLDDAAAGSDAGLLPSKMLLLLATSPLPFGTSVMDLITEVESID